MILSPEDLASHVEIPWEGCILSFSFMIYFGALGHHAFPVRVRLWHGIAEIVEAKHSAANRLRHALRWTPSLFP